MDTTVNTYSKSDVLAFNSTMRVFVDGIVNLIKQKRASESPKNEINKQRKETNYKDNLKALSDFIDNANYYPIVIHKIKKTYEFIDEVEFFIEKEYQNLLEIFNQKYSVNNNVLQAKFLSNEISNFGSLGKKSFGKKGGDKITDNGNEYIGKFIRVLIARRLLIYVMLKYNISGLQKLFTTEGNTDHLQQELLFSTRIKREDIWDDNTNSLNPECGSILTKKEIPFIIKLMNEEK